MRSAIMSLLLRRNLYLRITPLCHCVSTSPEGNLKAGEYIVTSNPHEPLATDVIDVRTQAEFLEDHIPGAINMPVLDNKQRHDVGKLYNELPFEARKTGAQIISHNIGHHIEQYFQNKGQEYCPLIYCWRGGQRSRSLAIVLSQIGFKVYMLHGGYKTYRRKVIQDLEELPQQFDFRIISGLTGTGKTLILHRLQELGEQVLDLESAAHHKGSLLGLWHGQQQPSQKYWESVIRRELSQFDTSKPVWVESESRRIGNCVIPTELFEKLCHSPRSEINLSVGERVKHIIRDYPNWIDDVDSLCQIVWALRVHVGEKKAQFWCDLARQQRWDEFVEYILVEHYDKSYSMSQKKNRKHQTFDKHFLADLSDESINELMDNLLKK
ncbi:tRNA 2-selenouridine synthase-like [Gigantopelta aegis]|uniref:tRNA 2-selenouridine synthase-like n=1 Tax=Gigantopelta aegis TaxID=1735272 RepID=UPI001B8874DF|nr:tRNA 2-selenouridine synthase-like [Gigantopelta aegis]XP_041359882.1 tRNA 2-selenouridine synthase-like [Gigantopelta aegis]